MASLSKRPSQRIISSTNHTALMSTGSSRAHQGAITRRGTSNSLGSQTLAFPNRPSTSTSLRLTTRNANAALQCWSLGTSEGGASGTQSNLLERAVSSITLTGVAEEGADGDFLRRVLKSGQLTGLHKACAQGNIDAVVSIVKIDSERQGELGYPGLSACDVFGRTPLMYAAVSDSKPCLDMLLTCGAKREVRDPNGHTAVHYATHFGQHKALKFLIEAACDWMPRDIYGRTPLHTSLDTDNTKCLQLLLKHCSLVGGDINQTDKENMTALHIAAHCGKVQHLSMLLKAGANTAAVDMEGKTALHWAVTNTDSACALALHKAYPGIINMRDIYIESVLHVAAKLGYAHIVDAVCSLENCNMDVKCRDDQSALHLATIHGQAACVSTLLKHGALDACVDSFGLSPLHYAIQSGHVEIVRLYCQLESLANLPDSDGRRPLHWAVVEENADILAMLVEHHDMQRYLNTEDKNGLTAVHIAIESSSVDCLSVLLTANATAVKHTSEMEAPVFMACASGNTDCVQLILDAGCNPNTGSSDGMSCLHAALLGRHTDVVKCLLQHNADPNVYSTDGTSALQTASFHGFLAAVDELLAHGARPNDAAASGHTALHMASATGQDAVLSSLLANGAAVNYQTLDEDSCTPMDMALENNHDTCVTVLRQFGGLTTEEILHMAATAIQAFVRGHQARKNMRWVVERKAAALLIQKVTRGFLQRQRYGLLLLRQRSAVTIQSHWRGFKDRQVYRRKLSELNEVEHRQHVINTLQQQLTKTWKQQGLSRTPPKAQPPVFTRKQLKENPPKPPVPPAYDLQPVKSVTVMLEEELAEERQERLATERRGRLEMALAMRTRHTENVRRVEEFHEREKERVRQKELDKERLCYSNIVQQSMKRQQHGRALLQRSYNVRATVQAAIAVQRCFHLWKERVRQRPIEEEKRRRQAKLENQAAETIQRAWKHCRRMKLLKLAKRLLNQRRYDSLMHATEVTTNVVRYQQPTLQNGYKSRKLLPTPLARTKPTSTAAAHTSRKSSSQDIGSCDGRTTHQYVLPPTVHAPCRRASDQYTPGGGPNPSDVIGRNRTAHNQMGSRSSSRKSMHGPAAMSQRQHSKLGQRATPSLSGGTGAMTRTALDYLPTASPPSRTSHSTIRQSPAQAAGKVVMPLSRSEARRWSIPSLPVLPNIGEKGH